MNRSQKTEAAKEIVVIKDTRTNQVNKILRQRIM